MFFGLGNSTFSIVFRASSSNCLLYCIVFPAPASQNRKYERERTAYIIQYTDYFAEKRTIESMVKDFASDYGLILKSSRIYQLLAPYVGKQLEKRRTTKKTLKGEESKKEVFEYIKKPSG